MSGDDVLNGSKCDVDAANLNDVIDPANDLKSSIDDSTEI
jgi:hypothetical protein